MKHEAPQKSSKCSSATNPQGSKGSVLYGKYSKSQIHCETIATTGNMAEGQNLRYLFSRDYHLFKRL